MGEIVTLDPVLGGGEGSRLFPLTGKRAKPAVPIGAKYRVIDPVLSNIVNSGGEHIYVLIQYKPDSLIRHVNNVWNKEGIRVNIRRADHKYDGTADAVYQNRDLISKINPDVVNVFGGDHIYLMDVSQMNNFHLDNKADLTIAAIPVPLGESRKFGVLEVDEKWLVTGFEEKPANPKPIPRNPEFCLASMGIYNFNPKRVVRYLETDARKTKPEGESEEVLELVRSNPQLYSLHDFGHNIISAMMEEGRVFAYNFANNRIVGAPAAPYWRDIGKLIDFYNVHRDMMGNNPAIRLDLPDWPVRTFKEAHKKPRINPAAQVLESILAEGVIIGKSVVDESSISYNVKVGERAVVTQSIFLGNVTVGSRARLNRVIVDKNVRIPGGAEIGFYKDEDQARGFTVVPGGITVISRDYKFHRTA